MTNNNWQKLKIKDLLDYERPDAYIVKSTQYVEKGNPVLTANKSFILGYTNESDGLYTNIPAIIFDDFTTDCKFVDFPFKIKSSAIKILKEKNLEVDLRFVYELMKSIHFPTGNHKRYYISQYQHIEVNVPPFSIQKKISTILSGIDEAIQKTDKIIFKTEELKQGLMFKLFSKGIAQEKFISTKLGEIPSDWKALKFEELFSEPVKNGLNRPTSVRGAGIKMVNMGELFRYPIITDQDMELVPLSDSESNFLLQNGDILFARQSLVKEGAGKCAIYLGSDNVTTYEGHIIRVRLNKTESDPLFYYYYFNSPLGHSRVESLITITAAAGIRGSELSKLLVIKPPLQEQKKISELLSSIDAKIQSEQKYRNYLKTTKAGIMHDIFSQKIHIN